MIDSSEVMISSRRQLTDIFTRSVPTLFLFCVLQMIFNFSVWICCVSGCVFVGACGAFELRIGLDLPSASLMHANLPLASQENNFSHSTNKVPTPTPPHATHSIFLPATQSPRVLTARDSSSETCTKKPIVGVSCRSPMESWLCGVLYS